MTSRSPEPINAATRLETLREDLVAYLDGELSAEEAARIERLINEDPAVRSELQRLAETWDWLDALDRPTVDEDFTRTTIEMVARSAVGEKEQAVTARRRKMGLLVVGILMGAVLSGWAGFWLAFSIWTNPNQWLLEHYAVIQNHELYRHVESVAFLRMLKDNGLFDEEEALMSVEDSPPPGGPLGEAGFRPPVFPPVGPPPARGSASIPAPAGPPAPPDPRQATESPSHSAASPSPNQPQESAASADTKPSAPVQPASPVPVQPPAEEKPSANGPVSEFAQLVFVSDPQEIRRQIAAMGEAEKYALRQKMERFLKLPASERERMLRVHQELATAADRAELVLILQRYYQWYKLLTPAQRGEMEALRAEDRIAWIRRTRNEMVAAAINRTLFNLPPERIRQLLESSATSRPEDRPAPEDVFVLMQFIENTAAQRGEQLLDRLSPQERQTLISKLNQLDDPQQRKEFLAITWLQWHLDHPDQSAVLTAQELDELMGKFSPPTQARLRALPRDEQLKRVSQWIRGSVFFRYVMPRVWADMRRPVSEQELSRFVEEQLSQEERAALLALPPEEMQRELTRRYLRWRYPGVGMGWHTRGGRGPDRDRRAGEPSDFEQKSRPERPTGGPGTGPGFGGPKPGGPFFAPPFQAGPSGPTNPSPPPPSAPSPQ